MSRIPAFSRIALLAIVITLFAAISAAAQETHSYVVLPFEYTGPTKYQYYAKAFQADLTNRLEWPGHYVPARKTVDQIKGPASEADAIELARSLGVDYVVWGKISMLAQEASLTLQIQGTSGNRWSNKGQVPISNITGWLKSSAAEIMGNVYQRPGYGKSAAQKVDEKQLAKQSSTPNNPNFLSGSGTAGPSNNYGVKTLNPQFRYEGGVETPGRWRSQTLRYPSLNMVVGDCDGDGENEVFILAEHSINAFRYSQGKLLPLKSIEFPTKLECLRLSLIDLDRDGVEELVLGGYQDERPLSKIISFKGGSFKILADRVRYYLSVLKMPPTYQSVLVLQQPGRREFFDEYMFEAYFANGEVKKGNRIATPGFANIYNTCYVPEDDSYKIAVLRESRRLLVYTPTLERQAETQETYNTSSIMVEYENITPGSSVSTTRGLNDYIYIPIRMTAANLTQKNKFELLLNRDISVAGVLFDRYHEFAQGEIHALTWDGVGMNLAWKTRRIKGTVTDYTVADLNNDGRKQLVILVNTYPGSLGFKFKKTLVVTYELDM